MDTAIAAHNIDFTYRNGVQVINNWSEEFSYGQVTALTGPSGSGKSTLLYLLGLMHQQTAGEITIAGQPTANLSDRERARFRANKFGFVFQDAALDPTRTILDNVIETSLYRAEPRRAAVVRAQELLNQFDVSLRATHRPGQVSGGQAQRIALCRALMSQPKFLLADEPTGNLDPRTRDTVLAALRNLSDQGTCVIVATHDPDVVASCDREVSLGERLFISPESH